MCGRFALTPDAERLIEEFGIGALPDDYRPRWNVAPGQPVLALAGAEVRAGWLHWGLLPWWSRPGTPARRLVNVRAETLPRRFARAFARRRCLLPADGFYEWTSGEGVRTPHFVRPAGGGLIALAAIWERGTGGNGGGHTSCAIITVPATGAVAGLHGRMPLIIGRESRALWLDRDAPDADAAALLAVAPPPLVAWAVSRRVNDVRNDNPSLVEPV
jgi:putative SOS response-associated peptidase YedK